MKCDPIVRAIDRDAGEVTLRLDLPADLPCFVGHFPTFPVLAGVVQLDWAVRLGMIHLGCGEPATDFRVKFQRPITPGQDLTLTLWHDSDRRRLRFAYRVGGIAASEGQIELGGA